MLKTFGVAILFETISVFFCSGLSNNMEVILSSDKIADCTTAIADEIVSKTTKGDKIVVIGIRSRGEILAKRLAEVRSAVPWVELELLGSWQDCGNYEHKVHEALIAYERQREWFKCGPDIALAAVQHALT